MRIQTIIRAAMAALVLIILLAACSQNPVGIFASIEREREILDEERGLEGEINVAAMTEAGGKYFIAAGTLYARDVDDPDYATGDLAQWGAIAAPDTNYTTNAVVSANLGPGERVYAVFTNLAGDASGVYEIDPGTAELTATPLLATGDTGSVGDDTVASVIDIFVVNDGTERLVVSVRESENTNDYTLYATSDGSTFTELANAGGGAPWRDAVTDGTAVAFMSASGVIVDADGLGTDDLTPKAAPDLTSGDRLTGLIYDDSTGGGGLLWLADDAGHIYTSADLATGTGWQKSASHDVSSSNDAAIAFTDFALVPVDSTTTNLVVGTRGNGYRVIGDTSEITHQTTPTLVSDASNYQGSELATAVVQTFYVDQSPGDPYKDLDGYLFFAGTTNQGLWRAFSNAGNQGVVQWVRE